MFQIELMYIPCMFLKSINFVYLLWKMSLGKDHDFGQAMVRNLQNTKFSIDERLEQSFINIFGRKSPALTLNNNDDEDDECQIDLQDQNQRHDQDLSEKKRVVAEYDTDEDSSDDEEKSEKEPEQESFGLREEVEIGDGRIRRRAISTNFSDDVEAENGDEVSFLSFAD